MTSGTPHRAPSADTAALRERAAQVVAELAARLADPQQVAAEADSWSALGLAEGYPGVTLLFTELARTDPAHRTTAHAHLSAAVAGLPGTGEGALYGGVPALTFAAHTARQAPGDYAGLLRALDAALARIARAHLDAERAPRAARRDTEPADGTPFHHDYDLIRGTTGLTRLLLARRAAHPQLLDEALSCLIGLLEPLPPPAQGGTPLPGWWSPSGPRADSRADYAQGRGHLNFGIAHGISGTLAVLAAAHKEGVRVPGLGRAVTGIAELLLARRTASGGWPAWLTVPHYTEDLPPEPTRSAWCYGTPGVACALYRAGEALDRADWRQTAVDAMACELAQPRRVTDSGLCHGWSGLLHLAGVLGHASGDPRLAAHSDGLAARVLENYDPRLPFGFRTDGPSGTEDSPGHYAGLLMGAAGIALALHGYASGVPAVSGWDSALAMR